MQCRNCGAEIADKALICYRCGTATTDAKYQPAKLSSRRSSSTWIVVLVLLIVLLALAGAYYLHLGGGCDNRRHETRCPRTLDCVGRHRLERDRRPRSEE